MRLATFLELAREQILQEAVDFAKTIPALGDLEERALRDHLPQVLEAISADLRSSQSRAESIEKAQGDAPEASYQTSAQTHGLMRALTGELAVEVVAMRRLQQRPQVGGGRRVAVVRLEPQLESRPGQLPVHREGGR